MKSKKKTIVICLDSFKEDYLTYTPFLKHLTQKYNHGYLRTVMGYTSIGAAVVSGKYPKDTHIWREFVFSDHSSLTWIKLFSFLDNKFLTKITRLVINITLSLQRFFNNQGYYFSVRQIPLKTFSFISPATNQAWCQVNSQLGTTIFDFLKKNNINFFYHDWPSVYHNSQKVFSFHTTNTDIAKVGWIIKRKSQADFFWLRLWQLDSASHEKGPNPKKLKQDLYQLDNLIKSLFFEFGHNKQEFNFLLWSDHGMVKVKRNFNLQKIISNLKIKKYFLDSTSLRIESINKSQLKSLRNKMKDIPGYFLSDMEKKQHQLGNLKSYGNIIFLAQPGICFTPNFYSNHPVRGMHGYDPRIKDQYGYYITNFVTSYPKNKILEITQIPDILKKALIPRKGFV